MPIVELSFARMDRLLGWLTIGCQEIKSSKALMRVTHRMGVQLRHPSIDSETRRSNSHNSVVYR
jgi:hypothetical protein